jgi:DNA-binding transcriptional regulator YhcF (GntR family)
MLQNVPLKFENFPRIDEKGRTPKFLQLVNGIIRHIETGRLKPGDRLPSIIETSTEYYLARATVEKAYTSLLKSGHLTSQYRKGFFIADRQGPKRVLFVVAKLNESSQTLFNAVSERLGRKYKVDLFTYEYRQEYLCDILRNQAGNYQHVVLMPHYLGETDEVRLALQKIPRDRLVFLDAAPAPDQRPAPSVCYGCGDQFRQLLEQHAPLYKKYQRLHFVTTDAEYIPAEWYRAFLDFTTRHGLDGRILDALDEAPLRPGNAYLLVDDADLFSALKEMDRRQLTPGRDVGLVAFNDAGYKELLGGGISVISLDLPAIGSLTADLIAGSSKRHAHVPMRFVQRASL